LFPKEQEEKEDDGRNSTIRNSRKKDYRNRGPYFPYIHSVLSAKYLK
jgi:hypothetical protein